MRALAAFLILFLAAVWSCAAQTAVIQDLTHHSRVFGEERNFRVFLPPDYEKSAGKRYPVIYFFHGHSEKHNAPPRNRSGYDSGGDYGGDNIAAFVGRHDVIVVKWHGANPRTPGEDYVRPYNISPVETGRQFPLYFPELVEHIDSRFRTLAAREQRATAGLSMGGFMSFWVSGKYPHLVGSASNFMGSSEFTVGPREFPVEYRHEEMRGNYEGLRTRIVLGSKDFIRWYHRRMNLIWDFSRAHHEHEEFDWDHGTPGMARTLGFHMAAFGDPLPRPGLWHHIDVYPEFDVWGWSVSSDRRSPGFTVLENVSRDGFRSSVRERLPDGKLLSGVTLRVASDAVYRPGRAYVITDVNLDTGDIGRSRAAADEKGRLRFLLSGHRHEVSILEKDAAALTVAGWRVAGASWATAGQPVRLELTLLNKGSRPARAVAATVSSPNPGVRIENPRLAPSALPAGAKAAAGEMRFTVDDPRREIVRFNVHLGSGAALPIEVPLFAGAAPLDGFRILDGVRLPLWERAVHRVEKSLGDGNADGAAQAGETIAIAMPDGEGWRAVELSTGHPCVDLAGRLSDPWGSYDNVGATAKISLPRISKDCPAGTEIPFFARWQLPSKPEHALREGTLAIRIAGR